MTTGSDSDTQPDPVGIEIGGNQIGIFLLGQTNAHGWCERSSGFGQATVEKSDQDALFRQPGR